MSSAMSLRARLEAEAAGQVTKPRGNAINGAQLAAAGKFSNACWHLAVRAYDGTGERVPAPPELLPPLV